MQNLASHTYFLETGPPVTLEMLYIYNIYNIYYIYKHTTFLRKILNCSIDSDKTVL
jgi:hypothetical protein